MQRGTDAGRTSVTATVDEVSVEVITLALSVPVSLSGVPQYPTTGVNGGLPVSAELLSPLSLALTYGDDQSASTDLTIPPVDPAVRSYSGGHVVPVTLPLS